MSEPAAELPHGIITFLLTDVEGSTKPWELPGPRWVALARHGALIEATVPAHAGRLTKSQGGGSLSVTAGFQPERSPPVTVAFTDVKLTDGTNRISANIPGHALARTAAGRLRRVAPSAGAATHRPSRPARRWSWLLPRSPRPATSPCTGASPASPNGILAA